MALDAQVLQRNATAIGNGDAVNLGARALNSVVYVKNVGGTISAGTVIVEEIDDPTFTGTWSQIESVDMTTLSGAAGACHAVHLNANCGYVRARISVALVGGGILSATVQGR